MDFTLNDLAYTCDIDALHKKIDVLNDFANSNNNEISNIINNVVSKNELKRQDTIDVVAETDGSTITLTAEDTISNGMIVFRIYLANAQKNCYFRFEEGEITEYKGVSENITLGDVVIKPLARSEEFRASWLNSYEKNDNIITIHSTHISKISGVIIQGNSCTRNMTFTTNDLAYTCDIDEPLNVIVNAIFLRFK